MKKRPYATSIRTAENVKRYNINGRIYEFIVIKLDDGIPYGYCYKTKKYAWLYPDMILTEDKTPVFCRLI